MKKNPEMTKDELAQKISDKLVKEDKESKNNEFESNGMLAGIFAQMRQVFPGMPEGKLKKVIRKNQDANPEELVNKIAEKIGRHPFFGGRRFGRGGHGKHFNPHRR